jgi:NAD(P)-dependent dehydrogenase (short-subunit alcohol dehydrogenase family)
LHFQADFADAHAVETLTDTVWNALGPVDILACIAGADTLTGAGAKADFETKLNTLWAVDVRATIILARNFGAKMKARGRGCILTTGWDQALSGMEGDSGQLFCATKAAVMAFTKSLAKTLAPEVRVNGVAPGWIRTAWGETASETWQDRVRRETPLRVWGLPEDVAEVCVNLASPASAFLTGQVINVNGGVV